MTKDEQEALSRAYTDACYIILRLRSGNYALFTNQRNLVATGPLEVLIERRELQIYIDTTPKPREEVSLAYLTEGLDI